MKAVVYLRVSTEEQHQSGAGAAAQRHACLSHAERMGWRVHEEIFLDGGIHGDAAIEDRPALMDALACLEPGDVLLVAKRDRLARDVAVVALLERMVTKAKARIVSSQGEGTWEDAPADDPSTFLIKRLFDLLAQYEMLTIRCRTRGALQAKRRRGEAAGHAPYGFRIVDDGRRSRKSDRPVGLEPDALELRTLWWILDWRALGWSFKQIAEALENTKLKTKTGKGPWRPSTVSGLVKRAETDPMLVQALNTYKQSMDSKP